MPLLKASLPTTFLRVVPISRFPLPLAFCAERAPQRDFRMLNGEGEMGAPPEGSPFAFSQIPPRPVKTGQHFRLFGARLGLNVCWERANSFEVPPPALRRVGGREMLHVLSAPGRVW